MPTPTFYYDAEDELVIAKFPEDFADFLSDEGWEQDARDFLARWKHIETLTPNDELRFKQVIELAEEYAPIYEVGDETRRPSSKTYDQVFNLLRDMERVDDYGSDDDTIPWDREGALVNRFLSDMSHEVIAEEEERDEAGPEFPDVVVTFKRGDDLPKVVLYSIIALWKGGYPDEAQDLISELSFEFKRNGAAFDALAIISTLCSYIAIEVDERASA